MVAVNDMSDNNLEQIEQQLAGLRPAGAPRELRVAVLADVHRELRASRWDRRLARVAVVLVVVGVGLNAAFALPKRAPAPQILAANPTQESLVQVAIGVAEATDVQTARLVARRLASMAGQPLSGDDAAAIDIAVEQRASREAFVGKEG
jgi:hypothetical protein